MIIHGDLPLQSTGFWTIEQALRFSIESAVTRINAMTANHIKKYPDDGKRRK